MTTPIEEMSPVEETAPPDTMKEELDLADADTDFDHQDDSAGKPAQEKIQDGEEPDDDDDDEKEEEEAQGLYAMATSETLRPFVIISSSYLLYTITDGAIRMIVLLHAYNKGFSALEVAFMFTLYELAGAVTNLVSSYLPPMTTNFLSSVLSQIEFSTS